MLMKQRRLRKLDRNAVCELYSMGYSINKIARMYNTTKQAVWYQLVVAGVFVPKSKKKEIQLKYGKE